MKITPVEAEWIKEKVEKIDFLNKLFPQQVLSLINNVQPRLLRGNQTILLQGQEGRDFFLIYDGRVSVWVEKNKKRKKIASLKRGDYFGEISLLTGHPTTAKVVASKPTKLFFLNSDKFKKMVKTNKKLAAHILKIMRKRLTARRKAAQELMAVRNLDDFNSVLGEILKATKTKTKKKS